MSIQLRHFGRGDFDRLMSHAESPEFLYQWTGGLFTFPLDGGQLERYLLTAVGDRPPRASILPSTRPARRWATLS